MEGLTIHVDWVYFLGILASLIGIAWYSSARFTKIETDTEWIKEALKSLKTNAENKEVGAFASHSPISLTQIGDKLLTESGIKEYIDSNEKDLCDRCEAKKSTNPYEVQQHIFDMFNNIEFPKDTDDKLKKFAFDKGISMDIIRRVGAIYFRDICIKKFNMSVDEIDKHTPEVNK